MAKIGKKRLQVQLSKQMGDQVEALADRLGVSESAVGAMLIAAGLTRFTEVLQDPAVLSATAAQVRSELERQGREGEPVEQQHLGFGRSRGKAQLGGLVDGYVLGASSM